MLCTTGEFEYVLRRTQVDRLADVLRRHALPPVQRILRRISR